MDKHFVVSTKKSTFTCHHTDTGWEIDMYQGKGGVPSCAVSGKIIMPVDWSPTRVMQYLEVLDKA